MGKLATFGNVIIRVRGNDHLPPHFHVIAPDYEALIVIETLDIYAGTLPGDVLKTVRTWAADNNAALRDE